MVQWSGEKRRMQIFRGALPDSGSSPPHGMRKLRSMMPLPSRAAFKKVFVWLQTNIKSYCTGILHALHFLHIVIQYMKYTV